MKYQSIYQLSKQLSEEVLKKEIEKLKNSPMTFNSDKRFFISYDFNYLNLILLTTKDDQLLSSCFNEIGDLGESYLLEKSSINEMKALLSQSFLRNTDKHIYCLWIDNEDNGNSYFMDAYKDLISSKIKAPTNIDSLSVIYDKYVKPRNLVFKKKNIKKFHKFRDSSFINDLEYSSLSSVLSKNAYKKCQLLFSNAPGTEDEIVSEMNETFAVLNDSRLDTYTKGAIFLYKFINIMPYYGLLNNLFMAIFSLASYFYNEGKELLAVSLWQIIFAKNNLSSLINCLYETKSKDNHGDLMHFVYPFVSILKDGILEMTQELKTLQTKENRLKETFVGSLSKSEEKVLDVLLPSSIYSLYGIETKKINELTKASIPTINRFLKKLKDENKLKKHRIGNKDFYEVTLNGR